MNQETGKSERTTPWLVLIGLIGAMVMNCLFNTGCADSTGWRVEFGVEPIKSIDNHAGLKQEPQRQEKY